MKRLILCVGALVATVANVAIVQGALFVENFDNTPEGEIPPGWPAPDVVGTPTVGATSNVLEGAPFGGSGKSLHLQDPGPGTSWDVILDFSAPASHVVMEYYMRTHLPNDEGAWVEMWGDGGTDYSAGFRSTGYIGIQGGGSGWVVPELLQYNVDTWYHVIRTLDCTTNTGTFYVAEVDDNTWQDTLNTATHSIGADYASNYIDRFFIATSNTFGADAYIDEISIRAVPEPSSLAIWSLLALCGIGIGWHRRRKV